MTAFNQVKPLMERCGSAAARCALLCGVRHFQKKKKRVREPRSLIKIVSLRGLLSAASHFFFGSLRESEAVGSGTACIFGNLGNLGDT